MPAITPTQDTTVLPLNKISEGLDSDALYQYATQLAEEDYTQLLAFDDPTEGALPRDFDTVSEVLVLVRRLADEDYRRHLDALESAGTLEARRSALTLLTQATAAAAAADQASHNLILAKARFRESTLALLMGEDAQAKSLFKSSGEHVRATADGLTGFAGYAARSKFFSATLGFVAATEKRMEQQAAHPTDAAYQLVGHTVDGLPPSVAAFVGRLQEAAKRVAEFGQQVAKVPELVKEAMATRAMSALSATVAVARGLDSKAHFLLHRARELVSTNAHALTERVRQEAAKKYDSLERHGTGVVHLVAAAVEGSGRVLGAWRKTVATIYEEGVKDATASQALRDHRMHKPD